jgi:hypothetical protein
MKRLDADEALAADHEAGSIAAELKKPLPDEVAERNAELLKRLAELNEKIAAHTEELARRRGPG